MRTLINRHAGRLMRRGGRVRRGSLGLRGTLGRLNRTRSRLIQRRGVTAMNGLARKLVSHVLGPLGCVGGFSRLASKLLGSLCRGLRDMGRLLSRSACLSSMSIVGVVESGLRGVRRRKDGAAHMLGTVRRVLESHGERLRGARLVNLYQGSVRLLDDCCRGRVATVRVRIHASLPSGPLFVSKGTRRLKGAVVDLLGGNVCTVTGGCNGGTCPTRVNLTLRDGSKRTIVHLCSGKIKVRRDVLSGVFSPFFAAGAAKRTTNVNLCLDGRVVLGRRKRVTMHSRGSRLARFAVALPL